MMLYWMTTGHKDAIPTANDGRRWAILTTTAAIGHEWKMDGDKIATDADGNPVWLNGTAELSVKGDTISGLVAENKRHRTARETAEASLAKYQGIDDPDAARAALETVGRLDAKQLIDAGKVDEVRQQITQQYEGKITEANKARDEALRQRDDTLLDSAFNASEFARDRLAVPIEMVRATFGNRFKVEDGKIVAYDANGQVLYSDRDMGAPASFDEALEKTITSYKYKDTILKAPDAAGSGSGGAGGSRGRGRSLTRSQFEELNPTQKAEFAVKMRSGEANITD